MSKFAEREMLHDISAELVMARTKFPGKNVTMIALMEEVGELAEAMMDKPREEVYREAVQVAVMAMRCWLDGDHSVEYRREQNKLLPLGDVTSRHWEEHTDAVTARWRDLAE